jgi:hypothetical protein
LQPHREPHCCCCCCCWQALLGKAWALEALHEQRAAWELLSDASIRLPWAAPLHMELARLTLAQQDWDALAEVVARLQHVDSGNIMALAYQGGVRLGCYLPVLHNHRSSACLTTAACLRCPGCSPASPAVRG